MSTSINETRLDLAFDDDLHISVECRWRLEDQDGVLGTGTRGHLVDEVDTLKLLIGLRIKRASPLPPDRVELEFENSQRLLIIDDDELFEAFSIEPIGIVV